MSDQRRRGWPRFGNALGHSAVFPTWGLLLFLFSGPIRATTTELAAVDLTELPLETLMQFEVATVQGASKFEQKTTEAPSAVTIIRAEEIKRYGYRTLADVLKSVPGFYASYDRNYSFIGARGINLGDFNSRILLLVNGHRLNNNLTDGAYFDTAFLLDLDLVDRVEIIRGPGSVLYGNNAFFGVVNVITRQGRQVDGIEGSGDYASFNTAQGRVTVGKQFTNGVHLLLSGTLYNSDGRDELFYPEFSTPAQNNGVAQRLDDDACQSAFGSLSYRDFTLEGGYLNREKANPTAQYFTTFNDPRLRTVDERSYASLKFAHSYPDVVDVNAQIYYDRNKFAIGYPLVLPVGPILQDFSSAEKDLGQWWGAELQLTRRLWERHVVTAGAEFRDDFQQERQVTGQPAVSDQRQSFGIYAQGDFAIVTNLHLNAGVRYDHYSDFDPSVNPRLALIYNPFTSSTIKLLYGTAFRAPNFLELSNPQFQNIAPEEITSYELVYEQQLGAHWRSAVSGFYNEMNDLIVFDSGSFKNFDAAATGVELALEAGWTNGLRARLSYSYQETRKDTVTWNLPDSPYHLAKLNLSVPVYRDQVFAGLEFQYTGSRETVHTPNPALSLDTVQGRAVAGFGTLNFTLFSQNLVKGLEFSASIYNLLDWDYADPATRFHVQDALAQEGRSFRVKLTYRY